MLTCHFQNMKAIFVAVTKKGGGRQHLSQSVDIFYSKGSQSLTIPGHGIHIFGQFDGVFTDRYVHTLHHESSGDKCAEYRVFKQ